MKIYQPGTNWLEWSAEEKKGRKGKAAKDLGKIATLGLSGKIKNKHTIKLSGKDGEIVDKLYELIPNFKKEMRELKEQKKDGKRYPFRKIVDAIGKKSVGANAKADVERMNILEHFFYVSCGQSSAKDGKFHTTEQVIECISATVAQAMKRLKCTHLSGPDKAKCDFDMIEEKTKDDGGKECRNIKYSDHVARMECYHGLYNDNPHRKDYKAKIKNLCKHHYCGALEVDERCTKLNACKDYSSSWRDIYPDSKEYFTLIYTTLGLEKGAENLKNIGKKMDPKKLGKKAVRTFKKDAFHSPYMKTKKQILQKMLTEYQEKKKKGDAFIKQLKKGDPDYKKYTDAKKLVEGSTGEGVKAFTLRAATLGTKKSKRGKAKTTGRQLRRHELAGRNNGKTKRLRKEQQAIKQQEYEAKKTIENLEKISPNIQKLKNMEDLDKIVKLIKKEISSGKSDDKTKGLEAPKEKKN